MVGAVGIVLGLALVQYISNMDDLEFLRLLCSLTNRQRSTPFSRWSSSGACLWLPALFARISSSSDSFRLRSADFYTWSSVWRSFFSF